MIDHWTVTRPARTVDALLAEARTRLAHRPDPAGLEQAQSAGALIVDIRPIHQRQVDGEIPGAVVIDRNVLEWRLDPASPHRIPDALPDRPVIVVCNEGYASSLAAATLCELGLDATDLDGGMQAWIASGRPTVPATPSIDLDP
jgi:rhodanese-related sulfurtransferase